MPYCLSTHHVQIHIVSLPQTTILSIFCGLLKISAEIPFYGIDELHA